MRLLAVGQSLIGIKGEGARYEMSGQNQLPKFNIGSQSAAGSPGQARKPGLFARLKGVGFGWKGAARRRGETPIADKPLVQTTLALERVRVVRNDLTESDLVIVPVKVRPVSGEPTKPVSPSRGKGLRKALSRMAQRVTDAARSLV